MSQSLFAPDQPTPATAHDQPELALSTCPLCAAWRNASAVHRTVAGVFSTRCVTCCARLVRSARPLKHAQLAMLAALSRDPISPNRDQLINALRVVDAIDKIGAPTESRS